MVKNKKQLVLVAAIILVTCLFSGKAVAQTLVQVEGVVTDEQGSGLPGVSISAKNIATGFNYTTISKSDGRYVISGIEPGKYEMEVGLPGFKTEKRQGLTFNLGARLTINFPLQASTLAEEVTVTAEAPMVETTKSEVSGVVDRVKIDSLPLLDRDFSALTIIRPGVASEYGDVRSNAQPGGSEEILTDGVSNEWPGTNVVNTAIPADAIQEFRVMTNQYEAEYGNASGMIRSALTRSGTNTWHGRTAFFYRDELFDNVGYFVNHTGYKTPALSKGEYEKAPFSHYNWSGTLGGPIVKDKAHFFLAYEGLSHKEYSTITSPLVPKETVPWDETNQQFMLKLNYQMSEKNIFSFRYSLNRPKQNNMGSGGLFTKTTAYDYSQINHDFQLNWTNYPSDRTMNELRVFYSYYDYAMHSSYDDTSFMEVRPSGYFGKAANIPQESPTKRYELVDNFSLFLGNHSLKIGADISRTHSTGFIDELVPGEYVFDTDAPFDPNNFSTYPFLLAKSPKRAEFDSPYWEIGAYAQDSWKVTPRLTLNYGLRYNYYQVQFLDINHTNFKNFNPRIGFSYDPIGDGKTVIRGGIGTYSQNPMINLGLLVGIMDQLVIQYFFYPGYPDPNVPNPFLPVIPPQDVPISKYKGEPNTIAPSTLQATLGFQREFLTDFSASFDLVWAKGRNFSRIENDNPIIPGTGYLRPDNTKGDIFVFRMNGRTQYTALYVTLSKRYSHGWSLDVSYTLSKSMSDVESEQTSPYSYDSDGWARMYGPSSFDARHRLAIMGVVDLPLGIQLGGLAYYRSALPWTPFYLTDVNLDSLATDMVDPNRNSRRGFDQFYINLRLSKYIDINRLRFQLFAEVYNLTNRANFGDVFDRLGTPTFGFPTTSGGPRRFQFGARFDF
jgi:hypothetical protein